MHRTASAPIFLYGWGILVGALTLFIESPCPSAASAGDERACVTRPELPGDREGGQDNLAPCRSGAPTVLAGCRPADCCCSSCPRPPSENNPAAAVSSTAKTRSHVSAADRAAGAPPQSLLSEAAASISGKRGTLRSPPGMLPLRI
jgi:hypothetical protein